MGALISIRCRRSAAFLVLVGALAMGAAHGGGPAFGRTAVVVPAPAPQHRLHAHRTGRMHPGSPAFVTTIVRPAVPPVIFNPIVPGFVTFGPPVVIVTPVVAPIHHLQPVPLPPPVWVQPHVPVVVSPSPLFFAPPVQAAAPPASGQVLIIRRTGH